MKKNRVDCTNCTEFEFPEYDMKSIEIVTEAKCKLGNRVVFRVNGLHPDSSDWECGWFRYCEDFNDKRNEK